MTANGSERPPRIAPRATYRLQLHAKFTFADAAALVPYLAELGVSHLYLSPVLQAAPGSTHGYDVVDPDRVSAELGGETGFAALVGAARRADLGILLDIVPNHMSISGPGMNPGPSTSGAGTGNRWWLDVLENGPASYYAHFFDVDWGVGDERVILPILGERYGRALGSGVLAIGRTEQAFWIRAHDTKLPIAPRTLGTIVKRAGERIGHAELCFIGDALAELPSPRARELEARRRRHRDKAVLLHRLGELGPACAAALDAQIAETNADPAALDAVLEGQNYRLVHWSVAASHLSYRRFFDIATLVGIRNEEPDVLAASHRRIFAWLTDGTVDGVRIDHVDGLRDPAGYLARVHEVALDAWIVVEKILAMHEQLPTWPIDGTTGYDFLDRIGRLLVDPAGVPALTETFERYIERAFVVEAERRVARHEVMSDALHSELARMTELAARVCATSPGCRDYTRAEIETTLAELLAGYSTYRTYLGTGDPRDVDRERIAKAAAAAREARPDLDPDLLAFLEAALAFELPGPDAAELAFAAQQVSGPIVAKGDEDTLAYRAVRLLSRCEVGADVGVLADSLADLHVELAAGGPRSLLATATHDTKRGEDVRARIAVISELATEWDTQVAQWRQRSASAWGDTPPDRVFEYTMWQTLVGAWPLPLERAQRFAEKATREARLRTSWRKPDAAYEAARTRWLEAVYADTELVGELARFAERLRPHGERNSLAQLLVKLTAPGVPDLYQGTELADDSLVDPDNRRPVDFVRRAQRLREVADLRAADACVDLGAAKLLTIRRVLALRRREPALFAAPYVPLAAAGPHAQRVFAFARGEALITCVPRLGVNADGWRDTTLAIPRATWRDVLSDRTVTGGEVAVAELWRGFPIALLRREDG